MSLLVEYGNQSFVQYEAEDYTEYTIRSVGDKTFLVVLKDYQWVGMFDIGELRAFTVITKN